MQAIGLFLDFWHGMPKVQKQSICGQPGTNLEAIWNPSETNLIINVSHWIISGLLARDQSGMHLGKSSRQFICDQPGTNPEAIWNQSETNLIINASHWTISGLLAWNAKTPEKVRDQSGMHLGKNSQQFICDQPETNLETIQDQSQTNFWPMCS